MSKDFGHFTVCSSFVGLFEAGRFQCGSNRVCPFLLGSLFQSGLLDRKHRRMCTQPQHSGIRLCFLFILCSLPVSVRIHPRVRTLVLFSSGQILQTQYERPSILYQVRFAYQHSDLELGASRPRPFTGADTGTYKLLRVLVALARLAAS